VSKLTNKTTQSLIETCGLEIFVAELDGGEASLIGGNVASAKQRRTIFLLASVRSPLKERLVFLQIAVAAGPVFRALFSGKAKCFVVPACHPVNVF
jgi:hypothetical protein